MTGFKKKSVITENHLFDKKNIKIYRYLRFEFDCKFLSKFLPIIGPKKEKNTIREKSFESAIRIILDSRILHIEEDFS